MEIFINMHKCAATVEPVDGIAFSERAFFANSMGHNEKNKKLTRTTEMENLSLDISLSRSSFSRDLLQRFMGSGSSSKEHENVVREEEEADEEIELNLGLSLGGRFGVDKSSSKLVRSSSIASCLPVVKDDNDASTVRPPPPVAYTALRRTSSLPVETEEEWRKRKELQTLRRMEAKRRRSEKQKNLRAENRSGSLSLEERKEIEANLRERLEREKAMSGALRRSNSSQFGPANLLSSHGGGGGDIEMAKGKGSYVGISGGVMKGYGSQGSIESKGGSSSSDLGSKTNQGSSGEVSPASIQSLQEGINPRTDKESPSKRTDTSKIRARETGTSSAKEDMPSVFTRGDGPNGKRVDGILYKYGKGVEVRIMCVCHGTFHSPAEFVRHAGGADVDNPLKHIVINSNSSAML